MNNKELKAEQTARYQNWEGHQMDIPASDPQTGLEVQVESLEGFLHRVKSNRMATPFVRVEYNGDVLHLTYHDRRPSWKRYGRGTNQKFKRVKLYFGDMDRPRFYSTFTKAIETFVELSDQYAEQRAEERRDEKIAMDREALRGSVILENFPTAYVPKYSDHYVIDINGKQHRINAVMDYECAEYKHSGSFTFDRMTVKLTAEQVHRIIRILEQG